MFFNTSNLLGFDLACCDKSNGLIARGYTALSTGYFTWQHAIVLNAQITESRRTRESLFSTFRQDKLLNAREGDYEITREGNTSVHGGNALMDMYIFTPKPPYTGSISTKSNVSPIATTSYEPSTSMRPFTRRTSELTHSDLGLHLDEPTNTLTGCTGSTGRLRKLLVLYRAFFFLGFSSWFHHPLLF